jgi:hypothetical protein
MHCLNVTKQFISEHTISCERATVYKVDALGIRRELRTIRRLIGAVASFLTRYVLCLCVHFCASDSNPCTDETGQKKYVVSVVLNLAALSGAGVFCF